MRVVTARRTEGTAWFGPLFSETAESPRCGNASTEKRSGAVVRLFMRPMGSALGEATRKHRTPCVDVFHPERPACSDHLSAEGEFACALRRVPRSPPCCTRADLQCTMHAFGDPCGARACAPYVHDGAREAHTQDQARVCACALDLAGAATLIFLGMRTRAMVDRHEDRVAKRDGGRSCQGERRPPKRMA